MKRSEILELIDLWVENHKTFFSAMNLWNFSNAAFSANDIRMALQRLVRGGMIVMIGIDKSDYCYRLATPVEIVEWRRLNDSKQNNSGSNT